LRWPGCYRAAIETISVIWSGFVWRREAACFVGGYLCPDRQGTLAAAARSIMRGGPAQVGSSVLACAGGGVCRQRVVSAVTVVDRGGRIAAFVFFLGGQQRVGPPGWRYSTDHGPMRVIRTGHRSIVGVPARAEAAARLP